MLSGLIFLTIAGCGRQAVVVVLAVVVVDFGLFFVRAATFVQVDQLVTEPHGMELPTRREVVWRTKQMSMSCSESPLAKELHLPEFDFISMKSSFLNSSSWCLFKNLVFYSDRNHVAFSR